MLFRVFKKSFCFIKSEAGIIPPLFSAKGQTLIKYILIKKRVYIAKMKRHERMRKIPKQF